jgi:hypothetical protein
MLVVVGSVFVVTACAYGVMAVQGANLMTRPAGASTGPRKGAELMDLMDEHGLLIMGVEIGILAVAMIGAIFTDGFWQRRADARAASTLSSASSASYEPESPAAADSHTA